MVTPPVKQSAIAFSSQARSTDILVRSDILTERGSELRCWRAPITADRNARVLLNPGRLWLSKAALMTAYLCAFDRANAAEVPEIPWTANPVVARTPSGQLELFEVDRAGHLNHRWQKASSGDWSPWSSLGGALTSEIAVGLNADGALEVFGVNLTNHALAAIRQLAPNSPDWGAWTNLGAIVRSPAVDSDLDGGLEIFALDAQSNSVKHRWQTGLHDGWSDWSDLGGNLEPGFAVTKNRDGRLELFGVDATNQALVHMWQTGANGITNWDGWANLGSTVLPGVRVSQNADGSLEVFAVNATNNSVIHLFQIFGQRGIGWSPGLGLQGSIKPGISVGQNADGRLEIFAIRRADAALVHSFQNRPNASNDWTGWQSLGGSVQLWPAPAASRLLSLSLPAVARSQDGTLQLFAADSQGGETVLQRRRAANNDWLDWSGLEHSTFQYNSRTWQSDEGLPHNLVEAIAQTPDGYLWVGTRSGLARFDGVQFTTFDAKNTPAIKNAFITSLCVDHKGILWIATADGLVRFKDGSFSRYDKNDGLAGNEVTVVSKGLDGSLWIGTTTGVSHFRDARFTNLTRKQGLLSDIVRDIFEDSETNLWIATPEGLNCLKDGGMDFFTATNGLPHNSLRRLSQDRAGRLWIGEDKGMAWLNKRKFYSYSLQHGLSDSFVTAIHEDSRGDLWVGTYSGLNRFREGRFVSQLNNEGLPFDKVNVIFEDRDAGLWVGSREGLTRLTPKRFVAYTKGHGLTHNNVMSVLGDRNGALWIATWGGGLNQLKDDRLTAYSTANGLPYDLVLSSCEGADGSLWIGMDYDGGLVRLKDGKFTRFTKRNGLINAPIRVIHQDQAGALWIGTSRGLSCLKDGEFKNYTTKDHLAGNIIRTICEDHAGNLWFGTDGGLSRWSGDQFANLTSNDGLSDNAVLALYEDKAQNLWIGTALGGLNRLKDGRFKAYTTQQGLISDEVLSILEDDQGWLWSSCSKGVYRVLKADLDAVDQGKRKTITCIAYGKADGMESTLCNGVAQPAAWKTSDGRLWFPTTKGLVAVDPNIEVVRNPPPVYIEQVLADKKPMSASTGERVSGQTSGDDPSLTHSPTYSPRPLTLPPGRGELEFRFTALNFKAPEKSLFKYKLDGVDSEWVPAGTRRSAHYNNIYPGSYRFRVMACSSDGVWNEAGDSLAFVLLPHFWQTWWFQVVCALTGVGLLWAAALYATHRRMQRKLERLEREHAVERERGRIAKDIHDDLGSSLTRIMMLGERAEESLANREEAAIHARKIVASARATVQSLDEIVWAVNPENDTLDGLVGYISQYANQFFDGTPVMCRLEMPVALPSFTLPAEVRHDLFLVVKEALNNVLKHSHAKAVRIRVSHANSTVEITIEDDGRGFEVNVKETRAAIVTPFALNGSAQPVAATQAGNGHGRKANGLENMKRRMQNLGGTLDILSAPGKGTKLRIIVNLNHQA